MNTDDLVIPLAGRQELDLLLADSSATASDEAERADMPAWDSFWTSSG
jgi:hypothetical protein